MWKNCRRRDQDFKALRQALKLSRSYVQYVHISYMSKSKRFSNAKFFPQIGKCKQIRYLSLTGTFFESVKQNTLEQLLSELPSLYCLSVTGNQYCAKRVLVAAKSSKSLEVLCVNTEDERYSAVRFWKDGGYMPPNLKLFGISQFVDCIHQLTSSDHPAQLSIYPSSSPIAGNVVTKYPIITLSLYPNVELVTCPTASVCSSVSHFSDIILSRGNSSSLDPVSAIVYSSSGHSMDVLSRGIAVSLLPSSIESLCLRRTEVLASTDLTLLSEMCPKLVSLDIQGCTNSLQNLLGLADISSNCAGLAALNIVGICNIESLSSLWEVLSSMRKLRYLSIGYSFITERRVDRGRDVSLARMNLFAIDIISDHYIRDHKVALQVERLLPAFQQLQHLKISIVLIKKLSATLDLTNVLPNLPSLAQLFVTISSSNRSPLKLPTDSDCYSSLKKLSIDYKHFDVSDDLAQAFSKSPSLTYLYLDVGQLSPLLIELLSNFCRLCECYLWFKGDKARVCDETRVRGHSTVFDEHGICGCVKSKRFYHKTETLFLQC